MTIKRTLFLTACVTSTLFSGIMANAAKKLLEVGWDTPKPSYVVNNIRQMETKPFDGLVVKLNDDKVFQRTKWASTNYSTEMSAIQRIQWVKFTDNYLYTNVASQMDWFSDTDWSNIAYNAGILAQAAKLGRCKGILLDPEPYDFNPWNYYSQTRTGSMTFAQYKAKVRQRGAQFMRAVKAQMPYPRIFMFFGDSMEGDVAANTDVATQDRLLSQKGSFYAEYGLLPAFIDGMLDAASTGTMIIDGNEGASYYFTNSSQFYQSSQYIKSTCINLVSPENRTKYQMYVRVAQPVYGDYIFDLYRDAGLPNTSQLTATEKAQYAQYNTYYALKTANEYAWIWTMNMNWWLNQSIPSGFQNALATAKTKVNSYQSLGFSITNIISKLVY
ncbi:MAG TPA: hypothetical protein VHV83_08515 [Armatimonadota bacterium]|nr:hypothetical protein [Armatimonadota bacterium]